MEIWSKADAGLRNALTTDKHLGATIAHGDWVLADIDLALLACAAVFGAAAWKLGRRWRVAAMGGAFNVR